MALCADLRVAKTFTPHQIWHGLGDRYDAPGLVSLKGEIEQAIPGSYVHLVRIEEDGSRDQ